MTLLLSNAEVAELLPMVDCLAVLEDAYRELAAGRGVNRRRSDTFAPTSRPGALYSLKSMDGIAPSQGVGAVRINSDIVTWPERAGNARREKVPLAPGGRWVGLVLLFSSETGEPLAIFPDGYLQRLRVAATNGLGVKYLAREDAGTVGLLGSGWQASGQLMAIVAVRRIAKVRCYSTSAENREAFAAKMQRELGVEIDRSPPLLTPCAARTWSCARRTASSTSSSRGRSSRACTSRRSNDPRSTPRPSERPIGSSSTRTRRGRCNSPPPE